MAITKEEYEKLLKEAQEKNKANSTLHRQQGQNLFQELQKNQNVLEGVAHGAKTGVNQVRSGIESAGIGAAHTVTDFLGMDEKASELEVALRNSAKAQAERQAKINSQYDTNFGGLAKVASDTTAGVIGMAPTVAAFVLTPQGKAAAAGKGLQWGSEALGFAPLAAQSAGGGINQALLEGADVGEAKKYGALSAVKEVATELPFAGIGKVPALINVGQKLAGGNALARGAVNVATEGAEEAVAEYLDPYIQRATYNPNAENASIEDMLYSALIGGLVTGGINGGMAGVGKVANMALGGRKSLPTAQNQGESFENAENGVGQATNGLPTNSITNAVNARQELNIEDVETQKRLKLEQKRLLEQKNKLIAQKAQMEQAEREQLEQEIRNLEQSIEALGGTKSKAFDNALFTAMDEYTTPQQKTLPTASQQNAKAQSKEESVLNVLNKIKAGELITEEEKQMAIDAQNSEMQMWETYHWNVSDYHGGRNYENAMKEYGYTKNQIPSGKGLDKLIETYQGKVPKKKQAASKQYGEELDIPMAERDLNNVTDRNVKAYQQMHPEVREAFREQAEIMLQELNDTIDGGRVYGIDPETRTVNTVRSQTRHTSSTIEKLRKAGMTNQQIRDGLERIIRDHGAENTINAKRVETVLDDSLANGYQSMWGRIPKNFDYAYRNKTTGELQTAYDELNTDEAFENADNVEELVSELEYLDGKLKESRKRDEEANARKLEEQQLIEAYSELLPNMSVYESMSVEELHNEMSKLENASQYAPNEIAGEMMNRHRYLDLLLEGRVDEFVENEGIQEGKTALQKQLEEKRLKLKLPRASDEIKSVQKQIDDIEAKQGGISIFSKANYDADGNIDLETSIVNVPETARMEYVDYDINKLSKEVRNFYDMVTEAGKKYGFNVRVVDGIENNANGMYDGDRTILLNGNMMVDGKAIRKVFAHEVYHYLKNTDEHKQIIDLAIEEGKKRGLTKEQMVVEKYAEYARNNVYMVLEDGRIDRDYALDEIGASFIQDIMSDPAVAERMWNTNPTIAEKIVRFIEDVINQLRGSSKNDSTTKKAIAAYEQGLRNMKQQNAMKDSGKRYSLPDVEPIYPSSNRWSRSLTTAEVKAKHPTLFDLEAEESEKANPTQVATTVSTYRKIYNILKDEGFNGKILDASSGKGNGTKAGIEEFGFDVDDIEPFHDKDYIPKYTDYSTLDEKYDAIISNAVLNVLPQELRDSMVVTMDKLLNDGGKMFINVRGDDVKNAKSAVAINEDALEYFIAKDGSYQKGFTQDEFEAYLGDVLGDGYTIKSAKSKFGKISVIATKNGGSDKRYSFPDTDSDGRYLTAEQADYFKDSKVRDDSGNLMVMYHGSPNAGFTEFRTGTYFTPIKWYADGYKKQGASMLSYKKTADNPDTYEVYLNIEKPFDTRNPKERRIFEQEYYQQWGSGAPLADSGLPDWTDGMDLQEFIEEKGYDYDGLILDEGAVGGYGEEVKSRGLSYVVFNPEQVKNVDNQTPTKSADIRYSLPSDKEYMDAVNRGDMETAQRMVNEAAKAAGYNDDNSWRMSHSAPNSKDGFSVNLKDLKNTDMVPKDYWEHPEWYTNSLEEREAFYKVRSRIEKQERYDAEGKNIDVVMRVYRAVDKTKNKREDSFRNGDWVTPIRAYAENEGRMNPNGYRIIEQAVKLKDLYWNGDSIAELGFDDGENYAYADTKNNRKLLDPVTYEQDGSIIPLSKRFKKRNWETRYSIPNDEDYFAAVEHGEIAKAQEMVDDAAEAAGFVVRGHHGTVSDFTVFDRDKANASGDWGKGFYFTTSEDDVDANYATEEGGDLLFKIERLAEDMWYNSNEYGDMPYEDVYEIAKNELITSEPHTIHAALRMRNPVEIGGENETFFDYDSGYDYESDSYYDYPSGLLADFVEAVKDELWERDIDADRFELGQILDGVDDGLHATRLEREARDALVYVSDFDYYNEHLDAGEIIRGAFERMGFDGIIDRNVSKKFGRKMDGVYGDTAHYIVFSPSQIKDTTAVTYDDYGDIIPLSERFNGRNNDIRYSFEEDVETYGALPKGENPNGTNRDIDVPAQTSPDNRVSRWTRTAAEAEQIDDATVSMIETEMAEGKFVYEPTANKKQIDRANRMIGQSGWESQLAAFRGKYDSGARMTADDIVLGERLIQEAQSHGDYKTAVDLIADIAALGSEMGQSVQALSVLKRLTPQGKVQSLKRVERRINATLAEQGKDSVKIPDELLEQMLQAESHKTQSDIWDECIISMSNQVSPTLADKVNAWRYLAMLSNPKTHIRNFVGNSVMRSVSSMKRGIQSSLENRLLTAEEERLTTLNRNVPEEYVEFARWAWESEGRERAEASGGRYNDAISIIKRNQRVFEWDWAEKWRKGNENALFGADMLFKESTFVHALARYMYANNLQPSALQDKASLATYEKGVDYALLEADKATFQEASKMAQLLSQIEHSSTLAQIGMGAVFPFKKTPINILKRGVEYSPVGLLNGLYKMGHDVQTGKITKAEAIDAISAGLTGSAIMALGCFMASLGMIVGGGDEDDNRKQWYDQSMGSQNYALKLPNGATATIDWMAPAVMPLMAGAELYRQITAENPDNENSTSVTVMLESMMKVANPVLEMSMLQGLTDTLKSYNQGTAGMLSDLGTSMVSSYGGQFIPAPVGALARTMDDTVRSSYAPKNSAITKEGEKFLRQQANKLPVASSMFNEASLDVWGNPREREGGNFVGRAFNNFINPATYSSNKKTELDYKLDELYKATGNSSVYPKSGATYINATETTPKVQLNHREYARYGTVQGQNSFKYVNAFANSYEYNQMDDNTKAEIISDLYKLAEYQAKKEILNGRGYNYANNDYEKVLRSQMEPQNYYIVKQQMDTIADNVGTGQKAEQISYLDNLRLSGVITNEQFWYLRRSMIDSFNKSEMAACPYEWIKQL